MASTQSPPAGQGLLKSRRYWLFWASSLLSNMGTWMQQVAQPWVVLTLTGSSFWVGIDSFAMNAPGWIFTLLGGVLADRFNKQRLVLFFQILQFFSVLTLLLLLVLGVLQVWHIILISFLVGSTDALSMPAFQSIIPSLVGPDELPKAIALNSTQFNLSRVIGPALGGLMFATFGASVCFGANAVSFLPFFLSVYWIYPKDHKFSRAATEGESGAGQVTMSFYLNFLRDSTYRTPLLTLFISCWLGSPLVGFCSVIVRDILHGSSQELGWAASAFGLGGVVGALSVEKLSLYFKGSRRFATTIALVLGALTMLVPQVRSLTDLAALLFFAGMALTMSSTSLNTTLQSAAGNPYRGRVVSLFQLTLHGGISLGSLMTGSLAEKYGIQQTLLANGALAMVLQLLMLWVIGRGKGTGPAVQTGTLAT